MLMKYTSSLLGVTVESRANPHSSFDASTGRFEREEALI
jgi:hypothetical protein